MSDDTKTKAVSPRTHVSHPLVGVCVCDHHPTLRGRVRVALDDSEQWAPTVQGMVVRTGDRVLMSHPANWPEPIVVGVIDGLARRPEPPRRTARVLELKDDETVTIVDGRGEALFELRAGEGGPTVVCRTEDLRVAVDGELSLEGRRVKIRARAGETHIEATDDVVVNGEHIHLN